MTEKYKGCITFTDPAHALFDEDAKAVLTTEHGNLAIFSTKAMADAVARTSRRRLTVIPVLIQPVSVS